MDSPLSQALEIDSADSLRRSSCCLWRRRSNSHSVPAQPQPLELTNPIEHRRREALRRAHAERMLEDPITLPAPLPSSPLSESSQLTLEQP